MDAFLNMGTGYRTTRCFVDVEFFPDAFRRAIPPFPIAEKNTAQPPAKR
jgi:hypothetical protein